MRELKIEEMTTLRGGQSFDIRDSFNGSNIAAIVAAGNVAEASSTSSGGAATVAAALAGNQVVDVTQG